MYVSIYKDVVFIEGTCKDAFEIIRVDIALLGIGAQLRNLRDVKEKLYLLVKQHNGNCLSDFKYGQKQRIIAFDDVSFYGNGVVSRLPEEVYRKYMSRDDD
jgi:hypothetical protein